MNSDNFLNSEPSIDTANQPQQAKDLSSEDQSLESGNTGKDSKDEKKKNNSDAPIQPDPETLNTTDPQEHMKGPVSSLAHKVSEEVEKND
jgi:hypothetical protein